MEQTEFTRADIEHFFLSCCDNTHQHYVSAIYRLTDLHEPAWLVFDETIGQVSKQPLEVKHIVIVRESGKLGICASEEVKE